MINSAQWALARVFLKIFLRDRQAIFFTLFFPLIFITVFGLFADSDPDPFDIGVVNESSSQSSEDFLNALNSAGVFKIESGEESILRGMLVEGDLSLVLILPADFGSGTASEALAAESVRVLVDAAQVRQVGVILPILEKALLKLERSFRDTEPMFELQIEDVQSRSQSYLDFLLPGILAFTLMQISIAGSGFNIVEYRRKGILKRLFVTPIRPQDFIAAIVFARLMLCLIQMSVLLGIAVWFLDVSVSGGLVSLYSLIIIGTVIFLCLGFCLGSIAKTQQSVQAIGNIFIFPQMFLSGIFYPVEQMPEYVQPIAAVLPLTYVANGLREVFTNGLTLFELNLDLLGIAVWLILAFVLATRMFVWKEVAH